MAHQVSHEEDSALEDADQQQVLSRVVRGDLLAELADARPQAVGVDQDLPDRPVQLRLHHVRATRTRASSTIPGTATTSSSSFATTGQPSRSALGTLASTNTSWSFLRRPRSRSPGRRALTVKPGSVASIVQGPQRTGPSSSETRSYSRTARIPRPRSRDFVPSREESRSSSVSSI